MTITRQMSQLNKWRSNYNPLRGLTIQRAVSLLEMGERGASADLMWTYRYAERRHPTLRGLKARRLSAIKRLDWNIKTRPEEELPTGSTQAQADAQALWLRQRYEAIDNLRAAICFLALAEFRGFSHLEKQVLGSQFAVPGSTANPEPRTPQLPSEINHLELVDQWFWCRDGLYGDWQYNEAAASGRITGLPVNPDNFLIREVEDPISEIALLCFVRAGLADKDWDAFIEIYGIPKPVVIMPPNIPAGKESEYKSASESIADGQIGALPNGSDAKWPTEARGTQPFLDRLKRLDEQLVLAGTGGLLTMLTEAGSGTLAGNAHQDTFHEIAIAEALAISEIFQKQFDAAALAEKFPGQPILAYFELAAKEETDPEQIIKDAKELSLAGYRMDVDELSEKTGYTLEFIELKPKLPGGELPIGGPRSVVADAGQSGLAGASPSLSNRFVGWLRALVNRQADSLDALVAANAQDFAPIRAALEALAATHDPAEFTVALTTLQNRVAAFQLDPNNSATAKTLEAALAAAVQKTLKEQAA